jgi:hypothetical protein
MAMTPYRLGFRVCDRRYPFLWSGPGQRSGRWNEQGNEPVHYLASSPLVAWAEWLRGQEISEPEDLDGVAAALWAVLIPESWSDAELPEVDLPIEAVLATDAGARQRRQQAIEHHKAKGALGLRAVSAAMQDPFTHPCRRCSDAVEADDCLSEPPQVFVLWCAAKQLAGWACVQAGRPSLELLPFVRHQQHIGVG